MKSEKKSRCNIFESPRVARCDNKERDMRGDRNRFVANGLFIPMDSSNSI
jgi:hypothetical protein